MAKKYGFKAVEAATAQRIAIFGTGGIGKTSLAARAPGPVAFIDLDESLGVLKPTLTGLDIKVVTDIGNWADLRGAIHDYEMFAGVKTIVIDSATKAESFAAAHVVANIPTEKGERVSSLEGYGWGKGYQFVYDEFLKLLGDLDQHIRQGRNVVLLCHDCTANVPNPNGQDYIRYEPRLQSPPSGKGSIRLTLKEWVDHLLFVGYDVNASKDGKAVGNGTRTIYPVELPTCMAKSRSLRDAIVYPENGSEVWTEIFK